MVGSPIVAEQAALTAAQTSAQTVSRACSSSSGTVSAMSGLAMPGCDIVAAAWATFAHAVDGYLSAFGQAADVLGGKIGAAAQTYADADTAIGTAADSGPTT